MHEFEVAARLDLWVYFLFYLVQAPHSEQEKWIKPSSNAGYYGSRGGRGAAAMGGGGPGYGIKGGGAATVASEEAGDVCCRCHEMIEPGDRVSTPHLPTFYHYRVDESLKECPRHHAYHRHCLQDFAFLATNFRCCPCCYDIELGGVSARGGNLMRAILIHLRHLCHTHISIMEDDEMITDLESRQAEREKIRDINLKYELLTAELAEVREESQRRSDRDEEKKKELADAYNEQRRIVLSLEGELDGLQDQRGSTIEEKMAAVRAKIATHTDRIRALEAEEARLKDQIEVAENETNRRIQELEARQKAAEDTRVSTAMAREREAMATEREILQGQIKGVTRKINEVLRDQEDKKELERRYNDLQSRYEVLQDELKKTQHRPAVKRLAQEIRLGGKEKAANALLSAVNLTFAGAITLQVGLAMLYAHAYTTGKAAVRVASSYKMEAISILSTTYIKLKGDQLTLDVLYNILDDYYLTLSKRPGFTDDYIDTLKGRAPHVNVDRELDQKTPMEQYILGCCYLLFFGLLLFLLVRRR